MGTLSKVNVHWLAKVNPQSDNSVLVSLLGRIDLEVSLQSTQNIFIFIPCLKLCEAPVTVHVTKIFNLSVDFILIFLPGVCQLWGHFWRLCRTFFSREAQSIIPIEGERNSINFPERQQPLEQLVLLTSRLHFWWVIQSGEVENLPVLASVDNSFAVNPLYLCVRTLRGSNTLTERCTGQLLKIGLSNPTKNNSCN